MPLSPGNSGWPSMSSAITHPVDQMSARILGLHPRERKKKKLNHTNISRVVGRSKDELWSAIVPGADVTDVGLASYQDLCRTKIA